MSPRLTPLTCKEIERRLKAVGFAKDHEDGSIRFWKREKEGRTYIVQVHFHSGERGLDVISSIMRTGGISRTEWLNA